MTCLRGIKKNQKGFTLVELMVVVVIIGILVAIAIPVYNSVQKKAKDTADEANIRVIKGAIQMYLANEGDDTGLAGGVDDKHILVKKQYLEEAPKTSKNGYYTIGRVESEDDDKVVTYTVKADADD